MTENNKILMNSNTKIMPNGTDKRQRTTSINDDVFVPPDGGARGWIIMVCSFFCNGILFGLINTSGVFHKEFSNYLESMNDPEASRKSALVESLIMGTVFFISPAAGVLTDAIGIQKTTFLGGAIASGGMLLSSFCGYNVEALYFTFGIMFGLGGALSYTPSLAILGHYFKKNLGVVNGIVTAGSATFTIIMGYLVDWLLKTVKIAWTFRILALLASIIMVCAVLFKPLNTKRPPRKDVICYGMFNVSIWRNKRYVIWAVMVPLSLLGYFVLYVHLPKLVEIAYPKGSDGKLPVTCIGITSLIGRLLFGYLGDLPKVNRIYLQQLATIAMGLLTMLIPFTEGAFTWLIITSLLIGLFDGCFVSLLGPVAFELCGPDGAAQAIGFLFGMCSFPLTLGPFFAGMLYDQTASYTQAFLLSGIPSIAGGLGLFAMKCFKEPKMHMNPSQQPLQYS